LSIRSVVLLVAAAVTFLPTLASGRAIPVPPQGAPTCPSVASRCPPEDFSFLAGRWKADPEFKQAEGPRPRYVNLLEITTSPTEIRINRGYSPVEVEAFRLDGTVTDFRNFKSSAVLVGDGVALTTRRTRDLGARGVSSTVWTDLYRVDRDRLTLVGRRTQTQSDGSLVYMPMNPLVTIVYRRVS